jgi:SAM-dependent methyltransferase
MGSVKPPPHRTAGPFLYDREAATYDLFNEKNSEITNRTLTAILRRRRAKTVLDLACGTGSQVAWLARRGFEVVGRDINSRMLALARAKGLNVRRGDMCTYRGAPVDAVLTISNAVGHLTKPDFARALRNIRSNLRPGGAYVFDIFNLDYLLAGDHITKLTIDWAKRGKRQIQYSTIDAQGVLRSFTTFLDRSGIERRVETLQVYSARELTEMLRRSGFHRVRFREMDGSRFSRVHTLRILTIAEC